MTTSSDAPRRRTSPALSSPTVHLLQRKDIFGTVARSWTTSYIPDYLGLILILLLYIPLALFITPFHRLFVLSDHHIQYPHAEVERVPPLMLLLYGLGIPLLAVTAWAVIFQPGTHKARVTYLGLVTAVFLTTLVTDIIKNAVGRPRPDLLARCKPAIGTPVDVLVDVDVCTETNRHLLQDGWRSFPSGHSSFSFSGLGFMGFFIAGQFHVLRPTTSLPAVMAAGLPFLGALLIAISRCEDYRHDVYDVTTGSVLGVLIAWLSYRRYYPGLRSRRCDMPYPEKAEMVKLEMRKVGATGEARDEESRVGFVVGDEEESEDERERIEAGRLLGGGSRNGQRAGRAGT
jgi:diacylglycerol diphosphate phosphatase/phosphatidate phosphatase